MSRKDMSSLPHVLLASLRCSFIYYCLDKLDRIDKNTCYVFHCATVSSSDIFGKAVSIAHEKRLAGKFRCNKTQLKQLLQNIRWWNSGAVKHIARLYVNTIWFVQTASYETAAHWSNWHVSMHDDTVCLTSNQAFCNNLSRQKCMKQPRSEASNTCLCITIRFVLQAVSFLRYDLICPDSEYWHIGAWKRLARLYALRYDLFCCWQQFFITIWFVLPPTISFHYDTICPTGNNLFAIRSDLSRQRPSLCITIQYVLLLKTVFYYDMICPDSCQTCS